MAYEYMVINKEEIKLNILQILNLGGKQTQSLERGGVNMKKHEIKTANSNEPTWVAIAKEFNQNIHYYIL
jgi:hypothetical protein